MQKSGVAHSIKDLEKALPSIASINGMQVKDYLQALSDENMIRVEKIGSGNWYWSFVSEQKLVKENNLEKAKEEKAKAQAAVDELQSKIEEATAARAEDGGVPGMDRKALEQRLEQLSKEVESLRQELSSYSQNDPTEVERKREKIEKLKQDAERWTDHIESMECWFKQQLVGDPEALLQLKMTYYGDQYDVENDCLKELFWT